LRGSFGEAHNLVDSAIAMRQRLGRTQQEGISWSVRGEVYRYERRFISAWNAYREAEQIFQALRNWSWLGLIYQEQAICLYQALRPGIIFMPDQREEAERRIKLALDICRDQAVRGYPSALNRAGRIFGHTDPEAALRYLEEGIDQARGLSDGRSLLSNLLDYVELSFRLLAETRREEYREQIDRRAPEIEQAIEDYKFQDMLGRWHLLQGHRSLWEALQSRQSPPEEALQHYEQGFRFIAEGSVGSRGVPTIAVEFRTFSALYRQLPPATQDAWRRRLRRAWAGSTSLLTRLDALVLAD
jgi:tetratricopeptide (TPR) repeat protein